MRDVDQHLPSVLDYHSFVSLRSSFSILTSLLLWPMKIHERC